MDQEIDFWINYYVVTTIKSIQTKPKTHVSIPDPKK